jgi:hypothetical protein
MRVNRSIERGDFFEDDALAGYAIVKIVAQAIGRLGADRRGDHDDADDHEAEDGERRCARELADETPVLDGNGATR